jgi:DNA-binding NtrC family response regulator
MKIALVIEDDSVTRRTIAQLLMRDGYGVCESMVPEPIPFTPSLDVIVTDVVTQPDLESVRAWTRSLHQRFGVPVVLVTGRHEFVAAGAAALGIADVVAKPFDVFDLVERVSQAVAAHRVAAPPNRWN